VIGWAADIFLNIGCLKHEESKERASLVRRGGGTTGTSTGVGVDSREGELCPKEAELRIFTCHDSSATADYHLWK
jgi:hypothetical protein